MKFKKIVSIVMALAMAVTMFSSLSTTANAAGETITLFEGEHELNGANSLKMELTGDTLSYTVDVKIAISYTITEGTSDPEIHYTTPDLRFLANGASGDMLQTTSGATITTLIDAEYYTRAIEEQGIVIRGYGVTISKVTITAQYNEWCKKDDGTYFLTTDNNADEDGNTATEIPTLHFFASQYGISESDLANVVRVTADVTLTGGFANGYLGGFATGDDYWQMVPYDSSTTLEFDFSLLRNTMYFETYWANVNTTITVSNIAFYEANQAYKQYNSDKTAVRFVQLISEELAASSSEVTFTISNGTSEVTRTSTYCYDSISVSGSTLTAPEGYVYVAYAITGIPSETVADALTCTIAIE